MVIWPHQGVLTAFEGYLVDVYEDDTHDNHERPEKRQYSHESPKDIWAERLSDIVPRFSFASVTSGQVGGGTFNSNIFGAMMTLVRG